MEQKGGSDTVFMRFYGRFGRLKSINRNYYCKMVSLIKK